MKKNILAVEEVRKIRFAQDSKYQALLDLENKLYKAYLLAKEEREKYYEDNK